MNRKSGFIFLTLFLLLLSSLATIRIKGEEFLPGRNIDIHKTSIDQIVLTSNCSLGDKIKIAKELLKSTTKLDTVENESRSGRKIIYTLVRKEIALAVFDAKTCDVFEERYWLDESDIRDANSLRRAYQYNPGNLPKFVPVNPNNNYLVVVNWWNNHNSDLSIVKQGQEETGRYTVIANKFLIPNDDLAYPEDRIGERYSDIVYVPYSAGIHTPELINAGRDFLNEYTDRAFKELKNAGIKSSIQAGLLASEGINKTFVKNLFLTEQTDPALIFSSTDNGQKLANRVLVRLGANGEKTFRYTYSKTGALGLGQIMPSTYQSIIKRYPEAKLIKDNDVGRVDIVNGIKATILILDDHFATVTENAEATFKGKSILSSKTPEQKEEIMAAAYNGGPGKYKPLSGTISLTVRETVDFVRKFKTIRELKLFN